MACVTVRSCLYLLKIRLFCSIHCLAFLPFRGSKNEFLLAVIKMMMVISVIGGL